MGIGKVQPCLAMLGREDRSFSLYHSLHTSLLQVLANSIWAGTLLGMKSRDGRAM
ncbi:hypothetical protein EDD17DRAFT_1499881 [Pisolithus thermaeus]|nr:hypothetical protein EDD17DRAFT_1499881 [Pisolithus thermaeus]